MTRKDGSSPAFGYGSPEHGGFPGMSKREYFAGQIMAALVSDPDSRPFGDALQESDAEHAVSIADALLKALSEDTQPKANPTHQSNGETG